MVDHIIFIICDLLKGRVDAWIKRGRLLLLAFITYTAIRYMVRGSREERVVVVAEAGSVLLLTKSFPFVTSICTPVDSLDRYVQLREMVVAVLEVMSRLVNGPA